MPKEGVVKKAERWETHHRIAFFAIVILATIILTRVGVMIHNPNPTFLGMELHHFDYGILLLIIGTQLSLFGPRSFHTFYIILNGIASALIIDEYWIIRHGVPHAATAIQEYNSSLFSVAVIGSIVLLSTLFLNC